MSTGSGQPKEELLPSGTTDQLYTTHDISRLLQVDPSTVSKWIDRGILMAFRTPGGHRRVRSADLRAFLTPGDCPKCGGSGYVAKPVELNGKTEGIAFIQIKCPSCGGTGRKRAISPKTAG
jgi:excisionase family DNA binding protein